MLRFPVVCPVFMYRRKPMTLAAMRATLLVLVAAGVVLCPAARAGYLPTAHFTVGETTVPIGRLFSPTGIAVDGGGNLYIVDSAINQILKETLSGGSYSQSTIPSSASYSPGGIAVDGGGNVYIADTRNDRVLKETLSGASYSESTVPTSALDTPTGIAVDTGGNLYVADSGHNRVLKETLLGNSYRESTLAGALDFPSGVAVDAVGNVYIADTLSGRVLKETLSGGNYFESRIAFDGSRPAGITVDGHGNVYVIDGVGLRVVKETLSGSSYSESLLANLAVNNSSGVAVDGGGNVYAAATVADQVIEVQQGAVSFGAVDVGSASGKTTLVFTFDSGGTLGGRPVLTQGVAGLDFAYAGTGSCSKGTAYATGDTCTVDVNFEPRFSGTRYGAVVLQSGAGNPIATGYVYGTGVGPQTTFLPGTPAPIDSGLANPYGLAVDAGGNLFFVDSGPDGLYNLGNVYQEKLSGGTYSRILIASGLVGPTGVAVDGSGTFYVVAGSCLYLYKQTLFDGSYHQTVMVTDLTGLAGIAVDRSGSLYLISSAAGDVHKETLQANGSYTETALGFGIANPTGIAVDGNGNLYIADALQGEVYEETAQVNGSYIQSTLASGLAGAQSVAVDGDGNLYISLPGRDEVLLETLQAGGSYLQTVAGGGLHAPWGIAVDGEGNFYYSHDTPSGSIARVDVADPPSLRFAGTELGSKSIDSPQSVTVANIGNAALGFPVPGEGTNPSIASGFTLDSATTCPEAPLSTTAGVLGSGSSCVYAIDFVPAVRGSIKGSLVLTDTNLNAAVPAYAEQRIGLSGKGVASDATRTTLRASPSPVMLNLGVRLTATVTDTTNSPVVPESGGVTFTDTAGSTTTSLNGGAAVPLSEGKAVLNVIPTVAGAHTITAHYGGVNGSFAGSTGEVDLIVQP